MDRLVIGIPLHLFATFCFLLALMDLAFGPQGIGAHMTNQEMDQVRGGVGFISACE